MLALNKDNENDLKFKLSDFEGPLDLLLHLINQNKLDIYDIPIAEITDQYLAYLDEVDELDLTSASDFLLMAATLTHIKSRMLLPSDKDNKEGEDDPRDELVLKLLAYRRCKLIAQRLEKDFAIYSRCYFKLPETAKTLGLDLNKSSFDYNSLSFAKFTEACFVIEKRNAARYQDLREKNAYILRREQFSLKKAVSNLFIFAKNKMRFFFSSFSKSKNKIEKITQFLALLELLKQNFVYAKQESNFADIEIMINEESVDKNIDFEDLSED